MDNEEMLDVPILLRLENATSIQGTPTCLEADAAREIRRIQKRFDTMTAMHGRRVDEVVRLSARLSNALEQLDALPKRGLSHIQTDNLMALRALLEGNEIIELEACDGACVTSVEGQCEECADLETRKERDLVIEHTCSVRRKGGPLLPCKACEAGIRDTSTDTRGKG